MGLNRRNGFAALLATALLIALPQAGAGQGQTGNFCVRDFQPGAVCTANDVRIEELIVVSVIEDCLTGTPGETEVVFQTLVSSAGSPDRYDIGLYLALDGGSARDGDSCYHDYLDPPLTTTPTYGDVNSDTIDDLVDGPWWDGDSDTCGDIESNTQLFKTLPALRFACIDSNGDGSADVAVCTSWDNNAGTACNAVGEAFPGTNSKCSCDAVELGIAPEPALTVVKTPASQNVPMGGSANFTFTVTSTTFISNVAVSDNPACTTLTGPVGDANNDSILSPDETWTYTCTIDAVMADFMDTVTATGDGPLGPVMDTDTANVTVSAATMTLAKTGTFNDESGDNVAQAGETITYSFLVTNTGSVALTSVAVSDPLPGLSAITCPSGNPIPSLGVAASETCTATLVLSQADVDNGQVDNTASANSKEVGPVMDSENVPLPAAPALTLAKTGSFNDESGDGAAQAGETITYSFLVTNTGNQTLAPVVVVDPSVVPITCPGGHPIPSLAPGASVTCTGTYVVVAADVTAGQKDNTATATGQTPGGTPVEDTDMETVPLPAQPPPQPAVSATKTSTLAADNDGNGVPSAGDNLLYTVMITNTGAGDAFTVFFDDTPDANTTLILGTVTTTLGTVLSGNAPGDTGVTVDLGTLSAGGGSATVTFEVRINDPLPAGVTTVANQGVVSGDNFPPEFTDDPAIAGPDDPTVDIVTNLASILEIPTLSEWALLLFALLLAGAAVRFLVR